MEHLKSYPAVIEGVNTEALKPGLASAIVGFDQQAFKQFVFKNYESVRFDLIFLILSATEAEPYNLFAEAR